MIRVFRRRPPEPMPCGSRTNSIAPGSAPTYWAPHRTEQPWLHCRISPIRIATASHGRRWLSRSPTEPTPKPRLRAGRTTVEAVQSPIERVGVVQMPIATTNPATGQVEQTFTALTEDELDSRLQAAADGFATLR